MPMAGDVQYCFDHMAEAGEITIDIYDYFWLFCPNTNAWFDNLGSGGTFEQRLPVLVTEEYLRRRKTMHPMERAAVTYGGVASIRYQLASLADAVAYICADDARELTGRRAFQYAANRKHMRSVIEQAGAKFLKNATALFHRCAEDLYDVDLEAAARYLNETIEAQRALEFRVIEEAREKRNRIPKRERKARRKVIRKSFNALASVVGKPTARVFVSRDSITIEGRSFDFVLRCKGPLYKTGHGRVVISLRDKDGTHLCDLCVYWEDTPALDQAAALALHVAADDEMAVIETANFYNLQPAAEQHDLFTKVRTSRRTDVTVADMINAVDRRYVRTDAWYPCLRRRAGELIVRAFAPHFRPFLTCSLREGIAALPAR